MFKRIVASSAGTLSDRADELFRLHPVQLTALLETAWKFRIKDTNANADEGYPRNRSALQDIPEAMMKIFDPIFAGNSTGIGEGEVLWDHLIYAYMIENTRIVEVFRKVLFEYLHGEKLGSPINADAQAWLRNTELLFFSTTSPFSVLTMQSSIRPDTAAYRRNSYYRMFGVDLNHGTSEGQPYPYLKAEAANQAFVNTFEQFLHEVWIGISNSGNTSGIRLTDDSAIANLASQLNFMLLTRRQNGNLSQAEFCTVAMMSWFHLTVSYNSPIVKSLRAEGSSEEQRLFKIAEKVKASAHGKAYDFFQMSEPLSRLLVQIELGIYNDVNVVPALYQQGPITADLLKAITHWIRATDHDVKVSRGKNLTIPARPLDISPA